METVSNVIIAGQENFFNRLYKHLDHLVPEAAKISYAPDTGVLFNSLNKKEGNLVFIEEKFIRHRQNKASQKIKADFPSVKIVLCKQSNSKINIQADFTLPLKFSKKDISAIFSKNEAHYNNCPAAVKLIREALSMGFTIRMLQVFNGIADDLKNKQIAEKIFKDERTVETHRKDLYNIAGVKSAVSIILYGIKKGWIDMDGNKLLDDELLEKFRLKKIE